jgi:hypothetical protein
MGDTNMTFYCYIQIQVYQWSVSISLGNLSMLCSIAAQALNLILLDAAARAKHGEILTHQSSNVHRSTGEPLFLCERPHREISY